MSALAAAVNDALLAFMSSAEFRPPHPPTLSQKYWDDVVSVTIPVDCRSSRFDVYVDQGKRVFAHALFLATADTDQLQKMPVGFTLFVERTLSANGILVELVEKIDRRTVVNNVGVVQQGFFAFVGALWNHMNRDMALTSAWLLRLIQPLIRVVTETYIPNLKRKEGPSRIKLHAIAIAFLRNVKKIQDLPLRSEESDSSFESTSSTSNMSVDIAAPSAPPLYASPENPIPPFDPSAFSPLPSELLGRRSDTSPAADAGTPDYVRLADMGHRPFLSLWPQPELPSPSGIIEELDDREARRSSDSISDGWLQPAFELTASPGPELSLGIESCPCGRSYYRFTQPPSDSPGSGGCLKPSEMNPAGYKEVFGLQASSSSASDAVAVPSIGDSSQTAPTSELGSELLEQFLTREPEPPSPAVIQGTRRPLTPRNLEYPSELPDVKGKDREIVPIPRSES
ncbi:hypothetical protein B0H19DRAFT_1116950 [Mycena capillaripes]|nr:hypothetical protein B0H19DRAFT_1116950 [Mycena capillaripes]